MKKAGKAPPSSQIDRLDEEMAFVVLHKEPCIAIHFLNRRANRSSKVYAILEKVNGRMGGGAYFGPSYGEVTLHAMQRMIDFMKINCSFTQDSRFIDIGKNIIGIV